MLSLCTLSALTYVNNYPTGDNPFGIKLPAGDIAENSFAFLMADYGLLTAAMNGTCCQTDVADLMRSKRAELEAAGKKLLFVGAGGDNFYVRQLVSIRRPLSCDALPVTRCLPKVDGSYSTFKL